jgi:myo-inositol-1(or 4)-monophosphatase
VPVWGVLIGLLEKARPTHGMMAQPFTGERFAGDGHAAWYAGPGGPRSLATRPCGALADAVLFTTSPGIFSPADGAAYRRVEDSVRLARYGCDCYAYCMVAAGFVDLVIEADLAPYDIVPLIPIIEGAGGIVTDWEGGPAAGGGRIVASGDARLHQIVLERLAG